MPTATEEHSHHTTDELEAELEDVRRELEAKRRSSSGWHLLALFAFVIAVAAFTAVILGANDKQSAVSGMHNQMNSQINGGGTMGSGSGMMGSGSGTATSKPAAGPAQEVKAQLGDYWVKPSTTSVPAGKVTFTATNVGQVPHELMIERMPIKMDAPGQPNEDAAQGMIDDMGPGESGSMTLDLKPGSYMLFCNVPGHYAMGQHTMFKVTG